MTPDPLTPAPVIPDPVIPDAISVRHRLDAALHGLALTFRGMTAHPDEQQCDCHWGSAEELALLKVPDVALDPDLLGRTWTAPDWSDHGAVLRRILPQFATGLANGRIQPLLGPESAGRSFSFGRWQQWPAGQAAAVEEFLHAWWAYSLVVPEARVSAHEVFVVCAEASGTVGPWLAAWEATGGSQPDRALERAVAEWEHPLLGDELPWGAWEGGDGMRVELAAWLVRHAPARLRACDADPELLHRVRLIGLTGRARWEDPHWPGHRY